MKHRNIAQSVFFVFIAALFAGGSLNLAPSNAQQQKPTPTPAKSRPKPPKLTSHVVLISISGLRADHANDPANFRLKIPAIQALRAKGSYAVGIESVYPSQNVPAHVSIATGVLPADHGITSDFSFNEQSGLPAAAPHLSASEIKAETLWDIAKREGLTAATVGFPMTTDAALNFNLPEMPVNADAIADLIKKERPNLLLLHFDSLDAAQRRFGLLSKQAMAALEQIDGSIGKIMAAIAESKLESETAVLIVSDRGASQIEQEFRPNVLLAKKKLLESDEQGNVKSWRAITQSFGGSAAVFLKNPQDEKTAREVEKMFAEIEKEHDNPLWRITLRRDAARLGADPRPLLYLDAAPRIAISPSTKGSTVGKTEERAAAGYLPSRAEMRAALILTGKGIIPNQRIEYGRLIDIAPTVARLLGLEMKSARGRVLTEVIRQ